jgi:two-component system response regulator FixJ
MSNEKTVYVVDDDVAVRESLSLVIELAGYRVICFPAATEFLDKARGLGPGCLVVDVRMPEMDGLELQERLTERGFRFPTIVMTGHGDVGIAVRAMKAGAIDFIEKPFAKETLVDCIRSAFMRMEAAVTGSAVVTEAAARVSRLSVRERQVLERLVSGLPNKVIAYDLSVSPRTVEVYRARVMDKMMASSLADLVRLALAAGVVPKSPEAAVR